MGTYTQFTHFHLKTACIASVILIQWENTWSHTSSCGTPDAIYSYYLFNTLCDAPLTNQTVTSGRIYIVKIYSNKTTLQIMCKPWTWCIYPKRSDGKSSVNFINTLCAAPLTDQTLTTSWRIHIFKMHSNETTLQIMWKPWACGSHEHWAIYI